MKMKGIHRTGIRSVSTDIARELLRQVEPRALGDFHLVEETAFGPPLAGLLLGDRGNNLKALAEVLKTMSDVIEAQAQALERSTTPDEFIEVLIRSLTAQLTASAGGEAATAPFLAAVRPAFEKHPLLLDRTTGALFAESPLRECEQALEYCTVKVIDHDNARGPVVSTGFVLCNGTYILTAGHVAMELFRELDVAWWQAAQDGGRDVPGRARVVHLDLGRDIAILEVDEATRRDFRKAGVRPPRLAAREQEELRQLRTLCLGYQDQDAFVGPRGIGCCTPQFYPIQEVRFEEGQTQKCLVLIIHQSDGQIYISRGTSGAPLLDVQTREVIGMVIGTLQHAEAFHPWVERWEPLSAPAYGFAVPLSELAESWPEFKQYCPTGT